MSIKATTMSNNSVSNASTNSTLTSSPTATTTTTVTGVKIKKELPSSDEIKEFAENTMNELLGWYGFDGVERLDLSTKTSRLLQTAAVAAAAAAAAGNITNTTNNNNNNNSSSSNNNNNNNNNNSVNTHQMSQQQLDHHMEKRRSRSSRAGGVTIQQLQQQQQQQQQRGTHMRNITNNNNNNTNDNNTTSNSNTNSNSNSNISSLGRKSTSISCNNFRSNRNTGSDRSLSLLGGANLCTGNESTNSDHDTRSSREDDSKSPLSAEKYNVMDEKNDNQNCCWCRRPVPENAPDFLTTTDGPRYCSESCFTQSRRASFKKAKTCDWCKHVRHAVSYVDFQDGASQLQFCSDKCLNQYKMQIFCKETQAHLDMNPHLRHQGLEAAVSGNGAGLITPDLWLRNCRSRSASPASTISVSPGPTTISVSPPLRETTPSGGVGGGQLHQSGASTPATTIYAPIAHIHKPVISVAPVSKLMSKSPGIMANRQSPKHNRKKRPLRSTMAVTELTGTVAKHQQPSNTRDLIGNLNKTKSLTVSGGANNSNNMRTSPGIHLMTSGNVKPATPTLSQFAGSSVQDLHMSVPPLSPMLEQQSTSHFPSQSTCDATQAQTTNIPSGFFATPPIAPLPPPPSVGHMPPTGFPPRGPFFPNASGGILPPRFFGAPMPQMLPHDMTAFGALLGAPPPVTVMVPYPIILPLPIPIPVPLPIIEFHKAYLSPDERERLKNLEPKLAIAKEMDDKETNDHKCMEDHGVATTKLRIDEPLDYTKSKDDNCEHLEYTSMAGSKNIDYPTTERLIDNYDKPASPSPKSNFQEKESSPVTVTHCIVPTTQNGIREQTDDETTTCSGNADVDDSHQKLPKFKITRLQAKRTLIQQTKESECTRPLRKRKRIIDCDFQKMALKDAEDSDVHHDVAIESTSDIASSAAKEEGSSSAHASESCVNSGNAKVLSTKK